MSAASIYAVVMGDDFSRLCDPVRQFHSQSGKAAYAGTVDIDAPATILARLLAVCVGAPVRACSGPIRFELDARAEVEVWTRHFPFKTMVSRLARKGDRVIESIGPACLTFVLRESGGGLEMRLERMHLLGVRCPRWMTPAIEASEAGHAGQLLFHVQVRLPVAGTVASYRGCLNLPERAPV